MQKLWVVLLVGVFAYDSVDASEPNCRGSGGLEYVCGLSSAEDLVLVPDTPWIIASGFSAGAGIALLDSRSGAHSVLYPGEHSRVSHDPQFAGCTAPPDSATLVTHGLNLRPGSHGHSTLYVVSHGPREAVEVFDVDATALQPALTWKGCIPMPEGLAANSVASFADGSLVATVLLLPGHTFGDLFGDKPTGVVLEWSPGMSGFQQIRGSELPGNNGIEVSADGQEFFVASTGLQTIVAFARTNPTRQLRTTRVLPFMPDNLHRSVDGHLLTAGMDDAEAACGGRPGPQQDFTQFATCPRGFVAMSIDPLTMQDAVLASGPADPAFSNATMVLTVGTQFWIGTFAGDRVGRGTLR